jgi:hypothetical protein
VDERLSGWVARVNGDGVAGVGGIEAGDLEPDDTLGAADQDSLTVA